MLEIIRGDDETIDVTIADSDGVAVDLTGATVFLTIKRKNLYSDDTDDSVKILTKTVTSHTNPTAGETRLSLSNTETNDLPPGNYIYDIQVKLSSGSIMSTVPQDCVIYADVTRRTS